MDKNISTEMKAAFEQIEKILKQIKFGSITLVVQDGKIIQVERFEKIRIK
ncbi:YezD family protein [Anaerotignum propionicum]|nr:YezD family protein [Anaerotignum propionicum]MCQ4936402.1 YezD family protein [Anaerotignum propionicum]